MGNLSSSSRTISLSSPSGIGAGLGLISGSSADRGVCWSRKNGSWRPPRRIWGSSGRLGPWSCGSCRCSGLCRGGGQFCRTCGRGIWSGGCGMSGGFPWRSTLGHRGIWVPRGGGCWSYVWVLCRGICRRFCLLDKRTRSDLTRWSWCSCVGGRGGRRRRCGPKRTASWRN